MAARAIPVLTYHGYNIAGNDYAANDHVALAHDLDWLANQGWQLVPLAVAVDALFYRRDDCLPERPVCITFDDGTDLDWLDVEFGALGGQRSLYGILDDFHRARPERPAAHATAFVIACPDARARMSAGALQHGHGMDESWWAQAERSRWLRIGNHSWDHRHPLVVAPQDGGGTFLTVDDEVQAARQVVDSGRYIARRTGTWPALFAYPWGQASDFLRFEFFPHRASGHGCRAAFGTEPGLMHDGSDRWYLPRFVCGQHWHDPDGLAALLQ